MPIFAVLAPNDNPDLDSAIRRVFGDHFKIAPGQWLISAPRLTTWEVTEKLGASDGQKGKLVVFSISEYWGYHDSGLWEWLRVKSD
jgi:hypothetical protein